MIAYIVKFIAIFLCSLIFEVVVLIGAHYLGLSEFSTGYVAGFMVATLLIYLSGRFLE
jgi:hypothetical protein